MNVLKCIQHIYPDWQGTVFGNSHEGIRPHELETRPTPSLEDLEAIWPGVERDLAIGNARSAREAEYRAKSDPIILQALSDGLDIGAAQAAAAAVKAQIRAKFPYPAD